MADLSSILKSIAGFFSSDDEKSISFYGLYTKMRKWRDSQTYPYEYELPQKITFPDDFWKKTIELYKLTRADIHERAVTVFWADGDLIVSSVNRGYKSSVTPRSSVMVRYIPTTKRDYLRKEVYLDNSLYSRKDIYYKRVPSQIEVRDLFTMHTHPPHGDQKRPYYTFFSLQDIKSLLASKAVITGLITDKLWILMRTAQTPNDVGTLEERDLSIETLNNRLKIVTYVGDFKSPLMRQPSESR